MCTGVFDPTKDRPVITGSVMLPTLHTGHEVEFIIDSGADGTCLSGLAAVQAEITPSDLGEENFEEIKVQGVDETFAHRLEVPVILGFEEYSEELDRWSLHIEMIDSIDILPKSRHNLLGRDILNRFNMDFRPASGSVKMERRNFANSAYACISLDEQLSPKLRNFADHLGEHVNDG